MDEKRRPGAPGQGEGDGSARRDEDAPRDDGTVTSGRIDATSTGHGAGPAPSGPMPEAIGDFRIVGKLGEGGMGVVYEAEQPQPKRRVALKVIRGGAYVDDQRLRMFQREIETLARLKHPNIGAIYESGRTEDGEHFFAMELVRGQSLGAYLRGRPRSLTADELDLRLRLFRKICDAVHYAHQRGVIHRDLKPSNIVVTEESPGGSTASGAPLPDIKILDFGLARITDADVQAATVLTEVGMIRGTLPYMSPEQTRGNPEEIDLRTDVYALGVILYEMLSGARPYDTHQSAWMEALRVICEEPPRPLRESWSGTVRLDADVETIVQKALEKEADRRYGSAAALAQDVERYLTSQPILARPPSAAYQIRKLMARNRTMFAAAATVVVVLVAATIVSTTLYVRAERAAERARTEASKSEQVAGFMRGMLAGVGPSVAQGRDTTMLREILDGTAQRVGEELGDQPEVEATIRSELGNTYWQLGEYGAAEEQFNRSLELFRKVHGDEHADVATNLNNLGTVRWTSGDLKEAERLFRESLAMRRRVLGDDDADTTSTLTDLGNVLVAQDRYDEAETLLREALEIKARTVGEDDATYATTLNSLANLLHHKGEYDEAEGLYRKALAIHREQLGELHPFTLTDMGNLAMLLESQNRMDQAEGLHRESVEMHRKVLGEEHPRYAEALKNLANFLKRQGDYSQAERLLRQSLATLERAFGEEHPDVASAINDLAVVLDEKGDRKEAEALYRRSLELQRHIHGDRSPDVATGLNNLANILRNRGEYDEAEKMYLEALDINVEHYGERHDAVLLLRNNLARLYREQGDLGRAAKAFEEIIALRREVLGEHAPEVAVSLYDLGLVLLAQGNHEQAEARVREAIERAARDFGEDHPATGVMRQRLGLIRADAGDWAEAEGLFRRAVANFERAYGEGNRQTLGTAALLGRALAHLGRHEESAAVLDGALARATDVSANMRALIVAYRGDARAQNARWTEAEADLLGAWNTLSGEDGDGGRAREVAGLIAALYGAWDAAEPDAGRDAEAAAWRERADAD